MNPMLLIVFALPVVLTVWVLWLVTTPFLNWSVVSGGLLAALVLTWAAYICLRFDGMDGSLHGSLVWRWSPTLRDKFKAAESGIGTAKGAAMLTLVDGDWPGFRGPQRDGRLKRVRIATDWNQNPPKEVWRHRVGPGWGSFAVVGDNLYTQEQRDANVESVVCYDAGSGKQIWAHDDAADFDEALGGPGPRATPTFHDGKIYALGAKGRLNCLNAATGAVVWSHDIKEDSGAAVPTWGFASSPLVVGDVATVMAGGPGDKNVLAYDAASGKLLWSAAAGKMTYSSPQPATIGGVEQVLCSTEAGLTAFDPVKGDVLWKYDAPQPMHRVVQPTMVDDSDLLVGSFMETRRVHVGHDKDGWKAEEGWKSLSLKPNYNDQVVYDGCVYGYDADSFVCVGLDDGRMKWRTKAYGSGQVLLLVDQGVLLVMSEQGEAVLVKAAPEKREELGRFQALEGKTWNHPVVAHGKLFVRNAEWAACYQLTEEGK